jgi:hypothetical protein
LKDISHFSEGGLRLSKNVFLDFFEFLLCIGACVKNNLTSDRVERYLKYVSATIEYECAQPAHPIIFMFIINNIIYY